MGVALCTTLVLVGWTAEVGAAAPPHPAPDLADVPRPAPHPAGGYALAGTPVPEVAAPAPGTKLSTRFQDGGLRPTAAVRPLPSIAPTVEAPRLHGERHFRITAQPHRATAPPPS